MTISEAVCEQAIRHVRIKTESKITSQDTWVTDLQTAQWDVPTTCGPGLWRNRGMKELMFWAGCDSRTEIRSCPSGDPSSSHFILYLPCQVLFYEEKLIVCGVKYPLGEYHFPQSYVPWLWLMFLNWYWTFIKSQVMFPFSQFVTSSFLRGRLAHHNYSTVRKLFQFGECLPYGSLVTIHNSLQYLIITQMNQLKYSEVMGLAVDNTVK